MTRGKGGLGKKSFVMTRGGQAKSDFMLQGGFGVYKKCMFFLQTVASLFLYYLKGYCEAKRSLFTWSSNQYDRGIDLNIICVLC